MPTYVIWKWNMPMQIEGIKNVQEWLDIYTGFVKNHQECKVQLEMLDAYAIGSARWMFDPDAHFFEA